MSFECALYILKTSTWSHFSVFSLSFKFWQSKNFKLWWSLVHYFYFLWIMMLLYPRKQTCQLWILQIILLIFPKYFCSFAFKSVICFDVMRCESVVRILLFTCVNPMRGKASFASWLKVRWVISLCYSIYLSIWSYIDTTNSWLLHLCGSWNQNSCYKIALAVF